MKCCWNKSKDCHKSCNRKCDIYGNHNLTSYITKCKKKEEKKKFCKLYYKILN